MNGTAGDLEAKACDPWGLFGKKERSRHCEGKKAEIVMYDHSGWERALCECGENYVHDQGAYRLLRVL